MPSGKRSIIVNRPIADVFAFFADSENDPKWRSGVTEIKRQGALGAGATYRQRIAGPSGRSMSADTLIAALETNSHVAFKVTSGPVRPQGEYHFRSVAEGTEFTFALNVELSGIRKLLMSAQVQKSVDAEMSNLDKAKQVLESPN